MGAQGLVAKGVPPQPSWIVFVRIAILVLSLILLALGAWSISLFGSGLGLYASGGAGGMVIFVAVWSFIVYGGATAVEMFAPHLFFRIIFLIGYIFAVIFWLSAWAWSANLASFWLTFYGFSRSYVDSEGHKLGAALAACAGLGAVVWILTIVVLAFFIKACIQDPEAHQAELGQVKHTEAPVQQPYAPQPGQQPQQPYPGQTPYGGQQPYGTQ